MNVKWSRDEQEESSSKKAVDTISKEKTKKAISFKTIFMIMMIIAILLLLLARAVFSLKDSFITKNKNIDEDVLVVDENLDVNDFDKNKIIPPKISNNSNSNFNDDSNNDDGFDSDSDENIIKNKIIKGKVGLAQTTTTTTTTNEKLSQDSDTSSSVGGNERKNSAVVKAEVLKLDPNLSIRRGTFIKCSLRTDLISQISGEIGCIINDDVYSANGHVLLIEKGSIVNGAFRRAGVNHGDSRIFVLWEEIITPNDIVINVNSGASDVLGGQGIDGWVDNHFWTRFGNAILVSLITDVSSSASSRLQKENTYNDFSNTADSGANVAKTIIEKNVDIPPTIYRNHGDSVGIYINQNIDFSDVYKLEHKK